MAELILDQVSKIHPGNRRTVDRVRVEVADGEFAILVGPSGCGKSTLLRMIAGLEEISEGEIRIDGKRVNEVPARDRDIAMVFQNYALYPHMSVRENMAFGLRMRGYPKDEIGRRVAAAAGPLGLDQLLDRRPEALSGGQRQRVAVGRAIVRQPRLFLFDEPLSNLDAKLRVAMRAELIQLHRRLSATMVYVTHDQVEAMSMGDRLIVLKDGVVQQVGPPLEVYDRPANLFVAGFIGSPAMNFLECGVERLGGNATLTRDGVRIPLPSSRAAAVAGRERVTLGIRPEHFHEAAAAPAGAPRVPVRIEFLEPLGSEVLANGVLAGQPVVVRLGPRSSLRPGDLSELALDLERARLFDPGTGKSLE